MSYRSGPLLRITMDILCPNVNDIYKIKAILKSQSLAHHNMVFQSTISPAIVTFKKEDSLYVLNELEHEGWEKVLAKPPILLK